MADVVPDKKSVEKNFETPGAEPKPTPSSQLDTLRYPKKGKAEPEKTKIPNAVAGVRG